MSSDTRKATALFAIAVLVFSVGAVAAMTWDDPLGFASGVRLFFGFAP